MTREEYVDLVVSNSAELDYSASLAEMRAEIVGLDAHNKELAEAFEASFKALEAITEVVKAAKRAL